MRTLDKNEMSPSDDGKHEFDRVEMDTSNNCWGFSIFPEECLLKHADRFTLPSQMQRFRNCFAYHK